MVVILGNARSGTSMLAGVVTALGFDPGAKLIPADDTNPKGHFEDRALWILAWRDRRPRAEIERYLAHTDHPRRLIKLPQLAAYLPLEFPTGTRFLWARRPLVEVLASARAAYGESADRDALLTRWDGALSAWFEDHEHLAVAFHEALADPCGAVERVAGFLGVPATDTARSFIDPSISRTGRCA